MKGINGPKDYTELGKSVLWLKFNEDGFVLGLCQAGDEPPSDTTVLIAEINRVYELGPLFAFVVSAVNDKFLMLGESPVHKNDEDSY